MKFIIKLLLIVAVAGFALWNYRIFTFNKGLSKTEISTDLKTTISTLVGIEKIEYYEKTIKSENYTHRVYVATQNGGFLFDSTQAEIEGLNLVGIFANSLKPEQIAIIPFYVEIIVGVAILVIPFGKRKKR